MGITTTDRTIETVGEGGRVIYGTVGTVAIPAGTMVAQLAADGTIVAASTALSGPCIGVAQHAAAIGAEVAIETDRMFLFDNGTGGNACSAATLFGYTIYCGDNYTVYDNSGGGTLFSAGQFVGMDGAKVRVLITPGYIAAANLAASISIADAGNYYDTDNVEAALQQVIADLALTTATHGANMIGVQDSANNFTGTTVETVLKEIFEDLAATTATNGANMVGFQDSGNKTAETTVDAVLDALLVEGTSTQGVIEIDLGSITDADGDFTKFANGAGDGMTVADSKTVCFRINNAGAPPKNLCYFGVPYDADITANMTLKFLVSKSGATNNAGNTTTITVEAFNQVDGALHDADGDYGGTTGAVVPDVAAKTLDVLSLTLALADLPAVGSKVSLTFKPTDGTLDTDDFMIHRMWVEYTRKLRTA